MIGKWHNAYHGDAPDYINCPFCQGELMETDSELPLPVVEFEGDVDWGAWLEATYDPDNERLEDLEL